MKRMTALIMAVILLILLLPRAPEAAAAEVSRDTVLVLDDSGSMYGEPLNALREAAKKFCETVLGQSGANRVAIVTYSTYAYIQSDFSDSPAVLSGAIDHMDGYGRTNIYDALALADELLENSDADIKNIVLMSDGLPNEGSWDSSGQYVYDDYAGYDYANSVYDLAVSMHPDYYIYTLGFFHNLYSDDRSFAVRFMADLQNAGYYEVEEPDDLLFTFGEIAEEITETALTGTFRYPSGDRDYSATYYYKDGYFYDDAAQYNQSLATMSLCLAMSAFGSMDTDDYWYKSQNVEALLTELQFTDFEVMDTFREKPQADTIAAAMGQKKIEDDGQVYTLLAVAVRGGGYEQEWASNFTVGNHSGNHNGFQKAADEVLDFIREYIAGYGISGDVKLWITGYSRAAAATNLAAAALDEGVPLGDGVSLAREDLFAYCFECPAGTTSDLARDTYLYGNIFNIINPNDLVTKVAPAAMGFRRYGVDKILPSQENKYNAFSYLKTQMLEFYYSFDSTGNYVLDEFVPKRVDGTKLMPGGESPVQDAAYSRQSMGAFLDEFLGGLVRNHVSRSAYAGLLEDGVVELCKAIFKDESKAKPVFKSFFAKLEDNMGSLLWTFVLDEYGAYEMVAGYLCDAMEEQGLTGFSRSEITKAAQPLLDKVIAYLANHMDHAATLFVNGGYFFDAHIPELCLAWMMSMDENYTTSQGEAFSNGAYRIIRINCPVDVKVYDGGGALVASFVDNAVQELPESSVLALVNGDGEKVLYLPADGDFQIEMFATDDGTVTYSVNEYSAEAGQVSRMVSYFDVDVSEGETLRAVVPAYAQEHMLGSDANGTDTRYSLFDSEGIELVPDLDVSGAEAFNAWHQVTAVSENEEYGVTLGSGIRAEGNFAQVTAVPRKGYSFEGWYVGSNLVSDEAVYRFRVEADITLTAKFTEDGSMTVWIAFGVLMALLLIVGITVLVVLLATKSGKDSEEDEDIPMDIPIRYAVRNPRAPSVNLPNRENTENRLRDVGSIEVMHGSMKGFAVPIRDGETIYVGKDPKLSNIVISEEYKYVSRLHCAITYKASLNRYYVVDCSTNGTYLVDRSRLEKGKRTGVDRKTLLVLGNDACTLLLGG